MDCYNGRVIQTPQFNFHVLASCCVLRNDPERTPRIKPAIKRTRFQSVDAVKAETVEVVKRLSRNDLNSFEL
ncbi:hypothetical protein AVEN_44120-1 [Araneus ventricosus]|uniref:Uncharacterized protein n=1 Tax=Araneus ventricosus TaxID=182803 RepID=A0A4Y2DB06_ARAVE|nr:hypothetical protein AVEN_44120-1 [Araneus ventricosus]